MSLCRFRLKKARRVLSKVFKQEREMLSIYFKQFQKLWLFESSPVFLLCFFFFSNSEILDDSIFLFSFSRLFYCSVYEGVIFFLRNPYHLRRQSRKLSLGAPVYSSMSGISLIESRRQSH